MSFVLDNSVALTWCFEDERTPATAALLERVGEAGALAPGLWPLEALNGLLVAERRGRMDTATRQRLAGFLHALPITLDERRRSGHGPRPCGWRSVLVYPPMMPPISSSPSAAACRLPRSIGICEPPPLLWASRFSGIDQRARAIRSRREAMAGI